MAQTVLVSKTHTLLAVVTVSHFFLGNQTDFVFEPSMQLLTFTPSPAVRACIDIGIINDTDVEGDHHFELVIENVTPGQVLSTSAVTAITITDNSGKR